jgi:Tol biopolymer transport system component
MPVVADQLDTDVFILTPRTNSLKRLHLNSSDRFPGDGVDWSHDGRRLVFSATNQALGEGNADLYTVAPDGTGLQQLTSTPENEKWPRWSPDDSRILFTKENRNIDCQSWIKTIAADGTNLQRVRAGCHSSLANWSPNGHRIVVQKSNLSHHFEAVWTMALDGTAREFVSRGLWPSYRPRCRQAPCSP